MKTFGLSDKGRYRAENQDAFGISSPGGATLAVVCDGMGGAAAGRLASEMAIQHFTLSVSEALEKKNGPGAKEPESDSDVLRQAADIANGRIFRFADGHDGYAGMGTTLVAGLFREDHAIFVHVGDSRAYRIARDGIVQITKDHSLVQEMVDRGELTKAQARRHPRRNIITRAVGSEAFVISDIIEMPLREGDIFLLCSDGLTNAVEDAELHRLVLAAEDAESACRSLVTSALDNNARDNITAIVIDPGKGGYDIG